MSLTCSFLLHPASESQSLHKNKTTNHTYGNGDRPNGSASTTSFQSQVTMDAPCRQQATSIIGYSYSSSSHYGQHLLDTNGLSLCPPPYLTRNRLPSVNCDTLDALTNRTVRWHLSQLPHACDRHSWHRYARKADSRCGDKWTNLVCVGLS